MGGEWAVKGFSGPCLRRWREYLQVPSSAIDRHIGVAFHAEGPDAVCLLDVFDAGSGVGNRGNAMNTVGGDGISVVAQPGGA
jgi:hypothetical protein